MVAEGNPNLPGTPAEQEYDALLDELGRTGWVFAGSGNVQTQDIGIVVNALDEMQGLSPEEFAKKLGLQEEDGSLIPGFQVGRDEDDSLLYVEYDGAYTDKVVAVFTGMVALADSKPSE